MTNKLPAFQFYPGDWKKDPGIQSLSFEDRGIWFEIMLLMHESEERGKLLLNGKPMPEPALARILGLDKQILTTTLTTLSTYGVTSICEDTGAVMSRRMVRDEKLRKVRSEAGKLGGNPNLVKQNPTTGVKQILTPSSSSSPSSSNKPPISPRGDGVKFNWNRELSLLSDNQRQSIKASVPGWDIYFLGSVYGDGVKKRGGAPDDFYAAFRGWCKKYTKGKPPC